MPPSSGPPPVAVPHRVLALPFGDGEDGASPRRLERAVAVETPVGLVYSGVPYAVMMATPADLEDFALGFSLTEGVVAHPSEIRALAVEAAAEGLRVRVDLAPDRLRGLLARPRGLVGRTGCGVCGVEDFDALPRAPRRAGEGPVVAPGAVRRALAALPDHQPLNDATRAVHAAAWAGPDGAILHAREDVGRHNALDKLIGALAGRSVDPASGFLLVTSRCSYEMVEKAAAFGAGLLVAISAPTTLGVERARHHGLTLAGIARADAVTVFCGPALRGAALEPAPA